MNSNTISSIPPLSGEIFDSLPPLVCTYIRCLEKIISQQQTQIQQLQTRVSDLESKIAKNSSNSGKPPSSDGLKKPPKTKSQREKSGKKPGGQNGHLGRTLKQIKAPDYIETHSPRSCTSCGHSLDTVKGSSINKRQVFDIPEPKVEVTEHRIEGKICPCCGEVSKGLFPDNVTAPVQYGERIQALSAYFEHQHFLPFDRLSQMFSDVFNIGISPGTCANIDRRLFEKLEPFEIHLKAHLIASKALHFDETGMRCEKKLHWVHTASSKLSTFYTIHAKRGKEAMNEADILPRFRGIGIHDHWIPYFSYQQITHGLCNTHHLRELTFIHEQKKEEWARKMKDLLILAKDEVKKHLDNRALPYEVLLPIEQAYTAILSEGFEYHSLLPPLPRGKRGRQKQRDGKNLLDRLKGKRDCVLRFMYDFSVPFTNNQGEQDIRMIKLKQKISGCFRTSKGGQIFCRIRSYLSTARKQGWNIWESLVEAINGCPRLLITHQDAIPQL